MWIKTVIFSVCQYEGEHVGDAVKERERDEKKLTLTKGKMSRQVKKDHQRETQLRQTLRSTMMSDS